MSDKLIDGLIGVLTAVVGLAIVAAIVSKKADTGAVLTQGGTAFASILSAALKPVS